jgi:AcrR family transcriptional regulator
VKSSERRSTRPYRAAVRAEQAVATRMRIARTACDLFARDGYAATTVAAVADTAGVSAQTVYNVFGTKAALFKVAYDITLAGTDEHIPLAERPDVKALYELTDAAQFLYGYAALGRSLLERVAPLTLQVHTGAAAGDADLVALAETLNAERLIGTGHVARRVAQLGALRPRLTVEKARDRIWTLNSVEVWHLLVDLRSWSPQQYEQWIGEQMCDAVLPVDVARSPIPQTADAPSAPPCPR